MRQNSHWMGNRKYPSLFFLITILVLPTYLFSQENNLVPNPGFEQYNFLPDAVRQGIRCAYAWKNPNIAGQGDYYHVDSKTKKYKTGKNVLGKQLPHSGNAFAGICISKKFREYLQVGLNKPLEKDKKYSVSIFISCADKFFLARVDEFNIVFTRKPVMIPDNEYLEGSPSITFKSDSKYRNKRDWVELSATYTAKGDEGVMTFGSFMYKEKKFTQITEHGAIYGLIKYAHYYVDDVSITPLQPGIPVQEKKEKKDSILKPVFIVGKTYVLKNIQFETAKSDLLPKAFPELDNLASDLLKNKKINILITGHTDNVGSSEDNKKLSYERAKTIMLYLISNGVDEHQLTIDGKGDQFPLSTNDTEEGREQNRRVEISFL